MEATSIAPLGSPVLDILKRYNDVELELADENGYPLSWGMSSRPVVKTKAEIDKEREAARPTLRAKLQAAQLRQKWTNRKRVEAPRLRK